MRLVLPLQMLASTPLWVLAPLFYFLTSGVIWALRDYQEGLAYSVARSSQLGDALVFTIVLLAVTMLQDGREVPAGLNTRVMQLGLLVIAVAIGCIWFAFDPTHRWGDRYHHLVVAPLLVYLGVNAGVIVMYAGREWEIFVASLLLAGWIGLVGLDIQTKRIDQRTYMQRELGIQLKN